MRITSPTRIIQGSTSPLYAAGFVTAFGAHSIAAGMGAQSENIGLTLLNLGMLLAVYDLAEVFLKPVFGALSDRIGAKPVIVGGLLAFAGFSLIGLWAADPLMLGLTRLGQGAAASAFSPASSATVARLAAGKNSGKYFGRYGSWKSLGYVIGPLLGAGLIHVGGFALLFAALSALAAATAGWVILHLPRLEPVPRVRYTVLDLARQITERRFLVPTMVLAASTGALGAAIGFLPALATRHGLDPLAGTAVVSALAIASVITQPWVGKRRDLHGISEAAGMRAGLLLTAAGIGTVAFAPGSITVFIAAILIGAGVGTATPLAFAHLADSTPQDRMGRTMGSAELGRELGDAGGPLIVGGLATLAGLPLGLGALALLITAASAPRLRRPSLHNPEPYVQPLPRHHSQPYSSGYSGDALGQAAGVPVSIMMAPLKVSRSPVATQRRGPMKDLVHPEKDSLEAMAKDAGLGERSRTRPKAEGAGESGCTDP